MPRTITESPSGTFTVNTGITESPVGVFTLAATRLVELPPGTWTLVDTVAVESVGTVAQVRRGAILHIVDDGVLYPILDKSGFTPSVGDEYVYERIDNTIANDIIKSAGADSQNVLDSIGNTAGIAAGLTTLATTTVFISQTALFTAGALAAPLAGTTITSAIAASATWVAWGAVGATAGFALLLAPLFIAASFDRTADLPLGQFIFACNTIDAILDIAESSVKRINISMSNVLANPDPRQLNVDWFADMSFLGNTYGIRIEDQNDGTSTFGAVSAVRDNFKIYTNTADILIPLVLAQAPDAAKLVSLDE